MKFLAEIHSIGADEEVNSWKASDIHKKLNVKSRFNTWIERRVKKNYFVENFDYIKVEVKTDGRPFTEYYVTLDMAKHLCMLENNEEGFKAREYFIKIEKQYRNQPQLIDGKDPRFVIGGHISVNNHLRKIIAELKAQLALPAPSVDVETYKEEITRLRDECYKKENSIIFFKEQSRNQVQKTVALKNVPKKIKQFRSQFLDDPKVYKGLGVVADELEKFIDERVA